MVCVCTPVSLEGSCKTSITLKVAWGDSKDTSLPITLFFKALYYIMSFIRFYFSGWVLSYSLFCLFLISCMNECNSAFKLLSPHGCCSPAPVHEPSHSEVPSHLYSEGFLTSYNNNKNRYRIMYLKVQS